MRVREKYDRTLKEICACLTAIRTFSPTGTPQFQAVKYSLIVSVLESAIDFNPAIPEADRRGVLRIGVSDAAKEKALDAEILLKHVTAAENRYLRKPLKDFVLATAFGMRGYYGLKATRINDVRISLAASLPRRFNRSAIRDRIEELVPRPAADIVQILARVTTRTPTAAFDRAQRNVDLMRAVWNYVLVNRQYQTFRFGLSKPINPILPGSVHTLHQPNGELINEIFWFEMQPLRESWIYSADKHWPVVQKSASKLLRRLKLLNYGVDIEDALIRFTRALDCADPRSSFSRTWSVFEYLADSTGNYERLITRACFLVPDNERALIRMLAQHLRDVRNGIVHHDEDRSNIETYRDQLKLLTERLFMFHLRNGNKFASRSGAAEYLDSPTDRAVLTERIRNYQRALRKKW
jgi:hypothetical protein